MELVLLVAFGGCVVAFVIWAASAERRRVAHMVAPRPPIACHSSIEAEDDVLTVYLDGEHIEDAQLVGDELILLLNAEGHIIGVQVLRMSSSTAWQHLPEAASIPADVRAEAVRIQAGVLGLGLGEREGA